MNKILKRSSLLFVTLMTATCLVMTGCSSSSQSKGSGAYTYGTGPNNTRPRPQTSKVNLNGVRGSTIR